MSQENRPQTVEATNEVLRHAYATIDALTFHDVYVIGDYPIGGTNRGQCELSVERHKKTRERRLVRRTTNKYGQWCKPHKSVYAPGIRQVVSGPAIEREAGWLEVVQSGIYLRAANHDISTVALAPCYSAPRREAHKYTVSSRGVRVIDGAGMRWVSGPTVDHRELPADDPEICDAWDVWIAGLRSIYDLVNAKILATPKQEPQPV